MAQATDEEKSWYWKSGRNSGRKFCAAYQDKRRPGQPACTNKASHCPYGSHCCFACGKNGHGQADCSGRASAAEAGVGRKRPATELDSELGEAVQGASVSSDTPPVRLPPFSAFGRNRRTAEPAQSLSASATTVEVSRVDPIELLVWKPSVLNVHGFGCVFQFACSMLNKASNEKKPLFIELNCTNSLYDSFRTPKVAAGWWSDIFEQP